MCRIQLAQASALRTLQAHRAEVFHRCDRCGGSGSVHARVPSGPQFDTCPVCEGHGEVYATDYRADLVTVEPTARRATFTERCLAGRALLTLGMRVVADVATFRGASDPEGASMPWELSFEAHDALAEVA